ncbi:hypothetical protein BIW11_08965 [Tropilaelaps mercedesae]|uniref:Uncharacterized protein n=1 Tax=Tropilaelaps mercedesae TaxID=418985 RepID=A0A1V9XMK6_9ACAR|nr:hypothetical protein BIW11_08965 [Tropilaelaps mercedesae]OQR74588.1 hypothetical protein BIW11_08965 [Tropilaelaps mercedesae]
MKENTRSIICGRFLSAILLFATVVRANKCKKGECSKQLAEIIVNTDNTIILIKLSSCNQAL